MARGESVDYAGTIEFDSDRATIESWTNNSGHYKPSANDTVGQQMVKDAFKNQFGIDLPEFKH